MEYIIKWVEQFLFAYPVVMALVNGLVQFIWLNDFQSNDIENPDCDTRRIA